MCMCVFKVSRYNHPFLTYRRNNILHSFIYGPDLLPCDLDLKPSSTYHSYQSYYVQLRVSLRSNNPLFIYNRKRLDAAGQSYRQTDRHTYTYRQTNRQTDTVRQRDRYKDTQSDARASSFAPRSSFDVSKNKFIRLRASISFR